MNEMFLTKKGLAKILSDYEQIKEPGKVGEFIEKAFIEAGLSPNHHCVLCGYPYPIEQLVLDESIGYLCERCRSGQKELDEEQIELNKDLKNILEEKNE